MNLKTKKQQLINSVSIGITVSIFIAIFLFFAIDAVDNRNQQRERLEVLERFLRFQSSAEATINESTNLLEGYLAYIETNHNISEEDTNRYLKRLLSKKTTLIRNIGIIKDTTIIWNYPREENEKAIGVDIGNIPSQRNEVLKVKDTLEGVFIGPVNLVQGDVGFIARLPIRMEGTYWGQISIVMDGDKYLNHLQTIAKESGLNIAIFNQEEFPFKSFYGDVEIIDRNGMVLDIEILNNKWKVATEPLGGWTENVMKIKTLKGIALLTSLMVGFFLYMIFNTRYQLNDQAMNDYLTGLHNRNFLEYYYQIIFKRAEANNELIGVFLLDINYFKKINDNYGHKIGDLVLIEFSKRLQSVGVNEKKVFRLGGDEFLILVSGCEELEDLKYVERKIRAEAVFRFKHENIAIEIMPSMGLATYPNDGQTLDEIMHIADSRMYEEKRLIKGEK
ncbi:MAG: sensor domain-containing diguanylate cyclase [Marinisporobacter sp.]|nr:sensor domain-containing diguanylate cyclase [Marinisporobacter sp.]